jgi:hypothetical protein
MTHPDYSCVSGQIRDVRPEPGQSGRNVSRTPCVRIGGVGGPQDVRTVAIAGFAHGPR